MKKKAIIIGAGPAGLTAAYELLKRSDITPVILEKSGDIGGISKTVNYKGNRIDIGGHRFFSKSDRVMNWWLNIMPLQEFNGEKLKINYQNKSREIKSEDIHPKLNEQEFNNEDLERSDKVMLIRQRLSRIYFLRKFFNYPIQLSLDTLRKLGLKRMICILLSYVNARLLPRKPENSLEDFFVNRFGKVLYQLFFKDYTEKVWGVPCCNISAEWGAQRIKGISIGKAVSHAIKSITFMKKGSNQDIHQKFTETSLIENFLYPKLGPGHLWEEVARQIREMGGQILHYQKVKTIQFANCQKVIHAISTINALDGEQTIYEGDYFFSTMPVQELIAGMNGDVPEDVKQVAAGLQYRDFITIGVLLNQLSKTDPISGKSHPLSLQDTWIYIQEKDVKVGRIQLFHNWSPYMVNDTNTVWIGMEYFCNQSDKFWNQTDEAIKEIAIDELKKIGLANESDVLDTKVLRMEKAYPAYFGTYNRFEEVRQYLDGIENLFLLGRNGMHKYNNADHSMLTAMVAVDNICQGISTKDNIWAINAEQDYLEEKKVSSCDRHKEK
jgi:protoporphyrinogen oxidase